MRNSNVKGLTLLEILLIVAGLTIIVGIIILIIDPNKELGNKNNTQRRVDVNLILDAVYQYTGDNNNVLPATITASSTEICKTDSACTGLTNLSALTVGEKYLSNIPIDPKGGSNNGTDYTILKTPDGKIVVSAPKADRGEKISATK